MRAFSLNVVLVKPLYDSNIGSASRAMANMGADRLILIAKQCEITFKAQQAAATGQDGLQNRTEYNSWDQFFANEDEGIRIAFSARDGKGRPLWDLNHTLNWLKTEDTRLQKTEAPALPIYLIFGPEDWGLANEDIELAHFNANIPTYGDNSSLNLAQAVLIALYTLRTVWGGQRTKLDGQQPSRFKQKKIDVFPDETLRTWISEMGFSIENKRISAYSVLKRMLLHNVPTPKELRILETVLQQSIRKLREYNKLYKEKQNSSTVLDQKSDLSERNSPNEIQI